MANNINGHHYSPEAVPATMKFLELLHNSDFEMLVDFHPGVDESITLVDRETNTAITLVVFESDDGEDI